MIEQYCKQRISDDCLRLEEKQWRICGKLIENRCYPFGATAKLVCDDYLDMCDSCRSHWFKVLGWAFKAGIPIELM